MTTPELDTFRVGITHDLGRVWDQFAMSPGTELLDAAPHITHRIMDDTGPELSAGDVADLDAVVLLKPRITEATVAGSGRLRFIARWGVGVDNIDVDACTRHGVLITVAPDGVRRPMALTMLTLVLALAHRLAAKHEMMRSGGWDRGVHLGTGLTGATVGLIGLGNIGRDFLRLIAPLQTTNLAFDPYLDTPPPDTDVHLVDLPTLMTDSDFVCIACPLNSETRHLIDAGLIAAMKPTSFVVNVARGGLVDETALIDALQGRRIAGAGLDVFEKEPLPADSPLRTLDNVILAPHSLGWTDELVRGNGVSACRAVVDVSNGTLPRHVLNPDALRHPRQRDRWLHDADEKEPIP